MRKGFGFRLALGATLLCQSVRAQSPEQAPETPAPAPSPIEEFLPKRAPFPMPLGGGMGGGRMGGMPGAGGGPGGPSISMGSTWWPSRDVIGQPTNLSSVRQDFSVSCPVYRDGPDMFGVTANVRWVGTYTKAVLPNSGQPFPENLWNIGMGVNWMHMYENGWMSVVMANVGSASDQPFGGLRDMNFGINALLRVPSGERNAWMFSVIYAPTGEFNFPIPGVAYTWVPNENFSMNIGLPFTVNWRATEDLNFDFSYIPVRTVHARASYRVLERACVYTAFDWNNDSYRLNDRPAQDYRFFYYEKRLSAGFRFDLATWSAADISTGFAFDRMYFQGRQYSDNDYDRINVEDGPFLSVRIQVRF